MPASVPAIGLRRHIPNALTTARLGLAVVFFALLALGLDHDPATPITRHTGVLVASAILFIIAAITDALDGHLARRWQAVSRYGRVMDPFADKILVLGAVVMLAGPAFASANLAEPTLQASGFLPWMAVVILARELLVTSLRAALETSGTDFSAAMSGKLKMVFQSVAVPLVLLTLALAPSPTTGGARTLILAIAWTTTAITAASAVPYITRAIAGFRNSTPREPIA